MDEQLWIVGQYISGPDMETVWDFAGVFSSREKAVAACRDDSYFIGPAALDFLHPADRAEWAGGEWPLGYCGARLASLPKENNVNGDGI